MPTSATGRSSNGPPPGAAARRASGFTLLEVLVVVVIIGIITTMAVVSTRVLGGDHEMDQEAARLSAVLVQAREDAILQGQDVGFRIDPGGYDFLRYDSRRDEWALVSDDPLLRQRALPDGMVAGLVLESRSVQLKPRPEEATATTTLAPQIVVQASGDLVPFEIVLGREGTEEQRRVTGAVDGTIQVQKDEDERSRR